MERRLFKWQKLFIEKVNKMNNRELIEETFYLAAGDDYDGCFTKKGEWEYGYLMEELYKRLGEWLKK